MSGYHFLKPFTFKHQTITLKNRIVIPPMTTRLSFEDGTVTRDEIRYYQQRAGGVGMFITGTANVNALGKGFEGELSVADDRFIPGFEQTRRCDENRRHQGYFANLQRWPHEQ